MPTTSRLIQSSVLLAALGLQPIALAWIGLALVVPADS